MKSELCYFIYIKYILKVNTLITCIYLRITLSQVKVYYTAHLKTISVDQSAAQLKNIGLSIDNSPY